MKGQLILLTPKDAVWRGIEDSRLAASDFSFISFSHLRHLVIQFWLEEVPEDISPFVTRDKVLIQ